MDISMMNGEGGPFMSGTWYNPNTGDSFTVRDTFFEDNNLIVMTTDGRRLNYDIISRYVKSDKPIPKQQPVVKQEQPKPVVPKELQEMLDDDPYIYTTQKQTVQPQVEQVQQITTTTEEDEDALLVRRIMKRVIAPEVHCNVIWKNYPSKQLEMLEMMGVLPSKIAEYIMKDFDLASIREQIEKSIVDYIKMPEKQSHCTDEAKITTTTSTDTCKDPLEVINTTFNTKTNELKESEQNANFTDKEYPEKLSKRVNKQQTKKTNSKK